MRLIANSLQDRIKIQKEIETGTVGWVPVLPPQQPQTLGHSHIPYNTCQAPGET